MCTTFTCRAYPTPEQAANLARTFGGVRKVWNETLSWRHARYHREGLATNVPAANAPLTAMKRLPESAYLGEVSSVPLQQVLRTRQKAFANFFAQRARYPRYTSRTGRRSAEYPRSAFRWRDGRLPLAKSLARRERALARDHDVIVAEDLAVTNMVRNRSLAKAVSDSGWGAFRAMLEYLSGPCWSTRPRDPAATSW